MSRDIPILFSAPMVLANLREIDPKTMTRRVVKPPNGYLLPNGDIWRKPAFGMHTVEKKPDWHGDQTACIVYAEPGDRLWVRETFQIDAPRDGTWHDTQWYGCKGSLVSEIPERFQHPRFCNYAADWLHGRIKWRPGIHMPRWASRTTLLVKDVRIERLQAISDADAIAEGIERGVDFPGWYRGPLKGDSPGLQESGRTFRIPTAFPCLAYRALWESINGPDSWALNPWVWVITYERIKP